MFFKMMFFNQGYLYKGHSFNSNLNTLPSNAHFLKMDLFSCIHIYDIWHCRDILFRFKFIITMHTLEAFLAINEACFFKMMFF